IRVLVIGQPNHPRMPTRRALIVRDGKLLEAQHTGPASRGVPGGGGAHGAEADDGEIEGLGHGGIVMGLGREVVVTEWHMVARGFVLHNQCGRVCIKMAGFGEKRWSAAQRVEGAKARWDEGLRRWKIIFFGEN